MNRLHLRLSNIPVIAILLLLAFSSAVYAQVDYSVTVTLSLVSGQDPAGLDGVTVTGIATFTQAMPPSSTMTTSSYSTNTYSGVTGVQLGGAQCRSSAAPTVTFTDNAGAPDTITLSGCQIQLFNFSATLTIPDGNMITAVPAPIPLTSITGTATYDMGGGDPTVFSLTQATIIATDETQGVDAVPTVTLSPTSWTTTAPLGSTTPLTQNITFITVPANDAVSFTTSASTADGGTWLTVSPATNTSSTVTITINPTGLTQPSYSGTVTLNYGQDGLTTLIPVTLTLGGGTASLTGPALMTFNYTLGGTAPASQTLSIGGVSGASVNAAVTQGNSWLGVSPGSGTVPANFTVSVNPAGLTAGTLSGNIQFTAANLSPLNIPVTFNVTSSTLTVANTPLTFNYTIGGSAPSAQNVSIQGTAGISFSTSTSGGAWLVATPAGTTVPGSVSISVNTTGLAAGSYNGSVVVTSPGAGQSPATIPVTLNVTGAPTLTASPSALNFSYQIGTTAPAAQSVSIGGTSGLAFTATPAGGSWLLVTPGSGTTPGSINVSISTSGLTTPGTYNGSITIAAAGATSQTVSVMLTVSNTPTISASPSTLNFAFQIGGTAPLAQSVSIGGTSGLAFTATAATSAGGSWLLASPGSGAAPGSVSVSVNTSVLTTPGTYNGTVTITASGAPTQTVNVTVVASNTPTITPNPTSLNFTYSIGAAAPLAQTVNISGGSGLAFFATVTSGAPWLLVTPGSGTTPGSISVAVTTGSLTAATYHGTVTIASAGASNTPLSIPVTLTVSDGSTPTISLSASSLNFTSAAGAAAPANQTVNVTSTAPSPVSVGVSGGTWLSATLSGSTTPAVVTVSANPSNLTAGTYSGTVIVTSMGASNTPQPIAVQLVVSAPATITATPASLSFAYVLGGSNPASQSVNVTSSQPAKISTSVAGASWLTVTSSTSSTPATLTATVNPAGLPAGTFQAAISITSAGASNSPQVLSVTLVVSDKPALAPSPSSLTFTAPSGGSNAAAQSINLSGSAALAFTVTTSPSWLSVSSSSSTTPATLVATVNTTGMSQGSYQGAITISSGAAANSPITIPVTLNLAVPLAATDPTISSIVSAASYDTSGFSPGAIVTIFGNLLGPQTGAVFSVNSKGSLDTSLAGVTVTVEGVPAIPLYVQNGQINAILPFTLGTTGQADVEVTYDGLTSAQFNIPLTFSDVQIFTANASGSGPGSILNQDYSVNTATNPAAKGSIVSVYGTGAGTVNPGATAGDVAGDVLSLVSLPYAATVNGADATIQYAGTAPSLVFGVNQFNVQLPADAPSGAVKIVLKVGDSASQPDVTVFVQ
jgi:uncharacterized protein (TIGR03437 family)